MVSSTYVTNSNAMDLRRASIMRPIQLYIFIINKTNILILASFGLEVP